MRPILALLLVLITSTAFGQAAGDYATLRKGSGVGDIKTYTTPVNDALWSTGSGGAFALIAKTTFLTPAQGNAAYSLLGHTHTASQITDFNSAGDARWSLLAHTHTFASLTSKPTTIAGYGITDFVTLGDAEWAQLVHTHVSADITDASTGGNGAADAGKLLQFGSEGEIKASSVTGINAIEAFASGNGIGIYGENNGTGNAIVGTALGGGIAGTFTATGNTGVLGQSDTQPGVEAITDNTTEPALHAQNNDAGNSGPIAYFHNNGSLGVEVVNDGGLKWTTATGAQTTATSLPAFGALTKGVVPAAGAVPSATKFLDETGAWAVPPGTGVTAVSVATANGLAGSSSGGATPALTLSTTVTGILQGNGTAISAAATTGSGSVVLATSPTLVTPALGTPTALTLTNATGLPAATGLTGQVAIANGGTGQSTQTAAFNALSPTTTKGDIIVDNGTDAVRMAVGANGTLLMANSTATDGVEWVTRPVSFPVIFGLNGVAITVTTTETVFNSTTVHQIQRDLTNYSQVRLVVNRQGVAGPTGAKAILKYRVGGQSTTVANFSDIGTSEVSCDIVTANTQAVSSWTDLAAGAKADVMITATLVCSSGTASPIIGSIEMQCR